MSIERREFNIFKKILEHRRLLKNAFTLAHENKTAVWWCDLKTDLLEFSFTAGGHLDKEFKLRDRARDPNVYRGRVFNYGGLNYLIIYHRPDNTSWIKRSISQKILRKIEYLYQPEIDYVIDEEGFDLMESK